MVLKSQKAIIGCVIKCKNSYFFLSSTTHRIDVLNFHCKCASKYPCISSNIGIKFKQLLALLAERMSPLTSEKIGRHLVHQAFLFYPHPILTPEAQTWRYRDYLCPMEQICRSGSLCCLSALQYSYSSLSSCQFSEVLDLTQKNIQYCPSPNTEDFVEDSVRSLLKENLESSHWKIGRVSRRGRGNLHLMGSSPSVHRFLNCLHILHRLLTLTWLELGLFRTGTRTWVC